MAFSKLRKRVKRFGQKIRIKRRARQNRRTMNRYRGIISSQSDLNDFRRGDNRRRKKRVKKAAKISLPILLAAGVGAYFFFNRKK